VLLIVLGFTTLGAWCATVGSPVIIWTLRIGAPLAAIATGWGIYTVKTLPESLPDHLRAVAGSYFEQKGLCFAPLLELAEGGRSFLCFYFQNRNSGHASTTVQFLPPVRTLRLKRHDLPGASIQIECPGGAFGVVRTPFPVPAKYQGKKMSFEIGADTTYPAGRGELLRHRQGLRIGATREMRSWHQLLTTLLVLPLGILYTRSAARTTLPLPFGVAETDADLGTSTTDILWTPDLPIAGFPVAPAHRTAA
jgi:hypothetical protein